MQLLKYANMKFAHHHLHTEYSPQDAPVGLKKLVEYSKSLGYKTLTVTDHGTVASWVKLAQHCKDAKIKPIFGIEGYFTNDRKLHSGGRNSHHIVLLAKNNEGIKNIYRMSELAWREGFYYSPRIDWELLEKHHEGVICTSACVSGIVPETFLEKGIEAAQPLAERFKRIFGGDFYMEVQYHCLDIERKAYAGMAQIARNLGIKILGTNDVHYLLKEDSSTQEAMMAVNTNRCLKDPGRMRHEQNQLYLKSPDEMVEVFGSKNCQAVVSALEIADVCTAELQFGKTQLPSVEIPDGKTDMQYLEELARKGMVERGKDGIPEYEARFKEEMDVIKDLRAKGMRFDRYFLVVWDYVNWAWQNDIRVGVGRGSGAGSLILYCLKITGIDPLPYDLLFERFLAPDRNEMPDIDIDFDYERGSEVFDYVCRKYGADRCAKIGTIQTFHAASAIKAAFRAFDPGNTWEKEIEQKAISEQQKKTGDGKAKRWKDKEPIRDETARMANEITKMLPAGQAGGPSDKCTLLKAKFDAKPDEMIYIYDAVPAFRDLKKKYPEIFEFAEKIEGLVCGRGAHPAGVLITEDPLVDVCPQQFSGKGAKKTLATAFDMVDVEKVGCIKFDFLRTKVLSVISRSVKAIKARYGKDVDIDNLVPNDPLAIGVFRRGDTLAIFQFEGRGMVELLKDMKPDCFEDVIAANALFRPGPIENIGTYVKRKHGVEQISYPADILESVLKPTYGIMVYQEQVMKITRILAHFSGSEADKVRKAMGKKKMDVLESMAEKFFKGIEKAQTCDLGVARDLWQQMQHFGEYAFNKSLDKDSIIPLANGERKRLEEVRAGDRVLCFDGKEMVETDVIDLHDHGTLDGIEVQFDDGSKEVCSANHKFLTTKGMLPLHQILREDSGIVSKDTRSGRLAVRKIISTRLVGKRRMYDLEVRHPAHNFALSNGVITSNSHSAGYAYTAYQCAWLKAHYPAEFMAAQLTVEGSDSKYDTVKMYEDGCRSMGIQMLPPNVNKAKADYTVVEIKGKKAILTGFKGVMGLGDQVYNDIVAGQPYRDMYDYCYRSGLGAKSDVVTALMDKGGFDWIKPDLSRKLGRPANISDIEDEYRDMSERAKRERNEKGARKEEKEGIKNVFGFGQSRASEEFRL